MPVAAEEDAIRIQLYSLSQYYDLSLLRVYLQNDATHALLTHTLVVSVNTGATEYSSNAQQNLITIFTTKT